EKILQAHGVPVPAPAPSGKRMIKPIKGCGAQGVRVSDGPVGEGEFTQQYIEGESFSVSLVASRVIGDACAYYTGKPPLVLAVNRQFIETGSDGAMYYRGGETPVHPAREAEIIEVAKKAIIVLGAQGYCGVDVVVADKVYVVDVNSRITTSIVGIAACMKEEIAEILVQASKGGGPDEVHLTGKVRFDTHGKVSFL
ncbi:MAG: ATP-grasp domain-containing protein, partial [Methanoregula sp.]|nr:ATP-grasp domain-containing protein [Methanoregula sp.]